jgi:hypothetical protein
MTNIEKIMSTLLLIIQNEMKNFINLHHFLIVENLQIMENIKKKLIYQIIVFVWHNFKTQ